jgi:hypothetical protein
MAKTLIAAMDRLDRVAVMGDPWPVAAGLTDSTGGLGENSLKSDIFYSF